MLMLYLSSEKHRHKLDALAEEMDLHLNSYAGSYSILELVNRGCPPVSGFLAKSAYIVIDLDCISDAFERIVDALQSLELCSSARIILYANTKKHALIVSRAVKNGFYNIVTKSNQEEEEALFRQCIEDDGMSKQQAQGYIVEEEIPSEQAKKRGYSIGFAGLFHRVGTTTLTMQMAYYLQSKKQPVCMVEANNHGHIATIPAQYNVLALDDKGFECAGIPMYPAKQASFRVSEQAMIHCIDFGLFEEITPEIFARCDLQMACCSSNPWESYWLSQIFDIAQMLPDLHFLFVFADESEQQEIRHMMGKYGDRCHFMMHAPSMFDAVSNAKIFEQIERKQQSKKEEKQGWMNNFKKTFSPK